MNATSSGNGPLHKLQVMPSALVVSRSRSTLPDSDQEPVHSSMDARKLRTVLRGWLPAGAAVFCTPSTVALSIPEEDRLLVARAVPSRQAEFIGGRWCAHQALDQLGRPAKAIQVGPLGEPLWPDGVCGSITHESGICMAAAAPAAMVPTLGIDLFDVNRKTNMSEIADLFISQDEKAACNPSEGLTGYLKLLFSAKESVVKAVSKEAGRFLDLRDISITVSGDSFRARLRNHAQPIRGKWALVGSFLLTMAVQDDVACAATVPRS